MANVSSLANLVRLAQRPPSRPLERYRFRLFAAVFASATAAGAFLILYYATLGLLPPTYVGLNNATLLTAWSERFDLAQFFGTLLVPPDATMTTWWVGLFILAGLLTGSGLVFALLCSWFLLHGSAGRGAGFGVLLYLGVTAAVSLGSGFNPAVMRQQLPDVGFMLLGWSGWASLQMLGCFIAYGALGGWLYDLLAGNSA